MRLLPLHEVEPPPAPTASAEDEPSEDDDEVSRDWQRVLVDVHLEPEEPFDLDIEDDDLLRDE